MCKNKKKTNQGSRQSHQLGTSQIVANPTWKPLGGGRDVMPDQYPLRPGNGAKDLWVQKGDEGKMT